MLAVRQARRAPGGAATYPGRAGGCDAARHITARAAHVTLRTRAIGRGRARPGPSTVSFSAKEREVHEFCHFL